jgi:signal transduction histidine kinase
MWDFFSNLFNTSGFPPRWHCGVWTSGHGWLHILSDTAVFGAYTAIPIVLAFFVIRKRDVPFPKIFWLFAAFIFACGFGHLIEAIIFWQPMYRFAGVWKLATATVSWATVIALIPVIPKALHLPGLAKLNNELRGEVEERRRVEEALRRSEEKLAALLASEREARGEAERASRIKDEFISTVSHELRTPLHAILGYVQLLQRSETSKDQADGLSVIERNAKVQAQIIEDLLDMSRIISGKVRLDVKTIDMVQVVEAAIATVRPAVDAKTIRIHSLLDPKAGPVLGDSGRLQQVVWNLLANAIKFTPKGGRVQVVMERINSHLELRVSDTGQGIKPEFLPHVFDRFRQSDSAVTRRHGGLGLGLSIVKQLVELHGGQVAAFSPGEGQGATLQRPQVFHLLVETAVDFAQRPQDRQDRVCIGLDVVPFRRLRSAASQHDVVRIAKSIRLGPIVLKQLRLREPDRESCPLRFSFVVVGDHRQLGERERATQKTQAGQRPPHVGIQDERLFANVPNDLRRKSRARRGSFHGSISISFPSHRSKL